MAQLITRDELGAATSLPLFADALMGVELGAARVYLLNVARAPEEPPDGQAAGAARPTAR
eukprot:3939711-Pyramimonas_sp.AAC.1